MNSSLSINRFLIVFFLITQCGYHKQSLKRVAPEKEVIVMGETDPTLQLINALNAGQLEKIKTAIEEGADIQAVTEDGLTLLIVAIRAEQYAILDYLIQQGADPEQKTESEEFYPAVNSFEFVRYYLNVENQIKDLFLGILSNQEFDITVLNEKFFDPSAIKNRDLVSWLLVKGANPNFILNNRETPLIYLFKQRGLISRDLVKLREVFYILVAHPEIDVNLKVGRRKTTALEKAFERMDSSAPGSEEKEIYQEMVQKLKSLGAQ